jgi:hypothetical protein
LALKSVVLHLIFDAVQHSLYLNTRIFAHCWDSAAGGAGAELRISGVVSLRSDTYREGGRVKSAAWGHERR